MPSLSKTELLAGLPPEPTIAPRPAAAKVVVLDDDPTGTQTVHGIPVLTTWEQSALEAELRAPERCFYILTNSRAFPALKACAINQEIGGNLARAAAHTGRAITVVSRSDSTLRGHFPAETDALASALGNHFHGTLIIPAFFAGGRLTIGDTHYVADGDILTPAGETEFARDASFGYRASNLRSWVEEKTGGRVRATDVLSISLAQLRTGDFQTIANQLLGLVRGGVAIVNAAAPGDLAVLTHALALTERAGRHYLFRTAADFVAAYAAISPRALLTADELRSSDHTSGGLLVAGSYVGKTSAQLDALFSACPALVKIEVAVDRLLQPECRSAEEFRCIRLAETEIKAGRSVALFTSRRLVTGSDAIQSLSIGEIVSASLVQIVRSLSSRPRWLVAKGGITSSDTATQALGIKRALVLGQAQPGVPVWRAGPESKWPDLAYVVFPGNVGGIEALARLISPLLT